MDTRSMLIDEVMAEDRAPGGSLGIIGMLAILRRN